MEKNKENKFDVFLLCLSPLFVLISNTGSFSVQSIIVLIGLSVINFFRSKKFKIKFDHSQKALLLLISVILLSTAINSIRYNEIASIDNIIEFLYLCSIFIWFYFNTTNKITSKSMKSVLKYYHIASLIMSIQIISMSLRGVSGKIMITNFAKCLMDENYVTALIAMTPIYCLNDILYDNITVLKKIINFFLILICSSAVALAGSRAALFALILGLFFTFIYFLKDKVSLKKMLVMGLIIIVGAVFILRLKSIMPTWIYNRYFHSNYMDHSNTNRILIWKNAISGIKKQPILGFGMGTFSNLTEYKYTAGKGTPAHQTILDWGLYGGSIGIILFIYFILSIFIPVWQSKKTKRYTGIFIALAFISMILSATKTVFLWNNLIYLKLISDNIGNYEDINKKGKEV